MTTIKEILHLSPTDSLELIKRKIQVDSELLELNKEKKLVDIQIKTLMGDYEYGICENYSISLKEQSRINVDYNAIFTDFPNIKASNYSDYNYFRVLRIRKGVQNGR